MLLHPSPVRGTPPKGEQATDICACIVFWKRQHDKLRTMDRFHRYPRVNISTECLVHKDYTNFFLASLAMCLPFLGPIGGTKPYHEPLAEAPMALVTVPPRDAQPLRELGRHHGDKAGCLSVKSAEIASGQCLLLPGDTIIPNNLTRPCTRRRLWQWRGEEELLGPC